MRMKQQGFTLIELVLSMVIGTAVIASALSLYVYAIRGAEVQKSFFNSQIAIDQSFSKITDSVRRATMYKNERLYMVQSENTGIIVTSSQLGHRQRYQTNILSASNVGASSIWNNYSDQLTVRYKPNKVGGYDCEGNPITTTDYNVIERYHVQINPITKKLGLFCDAGRFHHSDNGNIRGVQYVGAMGTEIAENIDLFKVKFLVAMDDLRVPNSRHYSLLTIDEYQKLPNWSFGNIYKYRIVGVQIGLINHSTVPASGSMQTQNPSSRNLYMMGHVYSPQETSSSQNVKQYTVTQQMISTNNGVGDL